MEQKEVIIVGAGPSGLAIAASLNRLSIPNTVLEREDCSASLWKTKSYDRLHLHMPKQYCQLPHMPFPDSYPKYVPKQQFLQYLDDYVSHFNISPLFNRNVESAYFDDEGTKKWHVVAKNGVSGEFEEYSGRFLVVATGDTCDGFIPEVKGLESFSGEILHSTGYKNGERFKGKSVLVVGCGNSGMEISLDLSNHGACTSIVARSPDDNLLNEDGSPKRGFPNHWKGENGLYCIGLAKRGFFGAAMDAQNVAGDIQSVVQKYS